MKYIAFLLSAFLIQKTANSQLVEIDLANKDVLQQPISLDKKGIRFINKLPAAIYKIVIESKEESIPPFSFGETFQTTSADEKLLATCDSAKAKLNEYFKIIVNEKNSEAKLADALK